MDFGYISLALYVAVYYHPLEQIRGIWGQRPAEPKIVKKHEQVKLYEKKHKQVIWTEMINKLN